ncbi:MAG: hypothetical protein LBM69_01855 [Lachnospiraceae bacterium]|nr:hypothetical protein [Lachnospiraceae bacterium]
MLSCLSARIWFALFKAQTEEELNRIIEMGVSVKKEASAIGRARRESAAKATMRESEKW